MIPHSRPDISQAEVRAVVAALNKRHMSEGPEVLRLENMLSRMFDGAEAIAVSSGTAALYLSLAALGLRPGERVIIPSYTCNSLFSAVAFARGAAKCADVAERGVNPDAETVKAVMGRRAAAAIIPHTCGFTADVPAIAALGCPVIEDCAQAMGGRFTDGARIGGKGLISVFSFYATKLVPSGEGGACVTRDRALANEIRRLRNCDEQTPDGRAFNFKMSDIHAALAAAKLKKLPAAIERRAAIADRYDRAFGDRSFRRTCPRPQAVCFRYLLDANGKVLPFIRKAQAAGITCRKPVWRPLHLGIGGKCPRAEHLDRTLVSVPLYPGLTKRETSMVCDELSRLL